MHNFQDVIEYFFWIVVFCYTGLPIIAWLLIFFIDGRSEANKHIWPQYVIMLQFPFYAAYFLFVGIWGLPKLIKEKWNS